MEPIGGTLHDSLVELSQPVGWHVPGSARVVVAIHLITPLCTSSSNVPRGMLIS